METTIKVGEHNGNHRRGSIAVEYAELHQFMSALILDGTSVVFWFLPSCDSEVRPAMESPTMGIQHNEAEINQCWIFMKPFFNA